MLKASLLYPMVNAKTSTERNYDGRRKTKNGAKTNAAGWLRRGLSRRSLFPEGRTYSPPPKCTAFSEAVVSLPMVGPCALRGGRGGISFSAENDGRYGQGASRPRSAAISAIARPARRLVVAIRAFLSESQEQKWRSALPNLSLAGLERGNGLPRLLRSLAMTNTKESEIDERKCENVWRFTTWKLRSSAAGRGGPPARRRRI